jgi:peptide/nickel transport system substrate-binding protein
VLGYRDISSVTGSASGQSVTVVFKEPFADWEMLFADLLPANVLEKVGWDPPCRTVDPRIDLSAGPFLIQSADPSEIVLARNPRWWGQTPNLDRIVVKIASSPAELARWLSTGKVQVVQPDGFDEQFLERVAGDPSVSSTFDLSTRFVQLEFSTTGPTTGTVAVRRALAFAIDRQAVVNQAVGWADTSVAPGASHLYAQSQGAYPGPTPPPIEVAQTPSRQSAQSSASSVTTPTPSHPFPRTADLGETARLLDAAGYSQAPAGTWRLPNGQPFAVRIAVDQHDPWAAQAGSLIVQELDAAGFSASELPAANGMAAGEDLASGGADAAVLAFSGTPYPSEAISWYTPELGPPGTGGSQDWSNFNDATLNQLLNRAGRQLNPVTAQPLYTQADALLWSQMVALPLFTEPSVLAWSNYTAGISPNPMGPGLLWYPETWAVRVPPGSSNTVPT